VLEGGFARVAVVDFVLRVNARKEEFTVLGDHASDAAALDDIGAYSQYVHDGL
jgi:hypothetical protein